MSAKEAEPTHDSEDVDELEFDIEEVSTSEAQCSF
jgi:hypothetical protein